MHITGLSIEGFRSLKGAKVTGMNPVTVLHGLNNSGKSNLLAALEMIFAPKVLLETTTVGRSGNATTTRRARPFYEGRIENFKDNFYFNQTRTIKYRVSIVFTDKELEPYADILTQIPSTAPDSKKQITMGDGHEKICNVEGVITRVSETSAEMTTSQVDFVSDYPIYKKGEDGKISFLPGLKVETNKAQGVVEGLLGQLSDCFRLIPANRYLLSESMPHSSSQASLSPATFKQWLFAASMARNDFHKFEEIQKTFNSPPFSYGEISFSNDGNELEIMVKKNGLRLPINRMGSGLQQILYLIAVIVLHKNKILAVEELEINLSPAAQKEVFNLLKKCVTEQPALLNQLFITSHSDYFGVRSDVKRFSIVYNEENSCTEVMPWSQSWRKEHFFHERLLDLEKEG